MSIDTSKLIDGLNSAGMPKKGYEVTQEGDVGTIETPYLAAADVDFDQILRKCGFNPDVYEIVGDPKVKRWEAQTPDGPTWLSSYGISVRKRASDLLPESDIQALAERLRSYTPPPAAPPVEGRPTVTAVVNLADAQASKSEGGGVDGLTQRLIDGLDNVQAWLDRCRTHYNVDELILVNNGDPIEGCSGNYDSQLFTVQLNHRQQYNYVLDFWDMYARTLFPQFNKGQFVTVLSNHGELGRFGTRKNQTGDSDSADAFLAETLKRIYDSTPGFDRIKWSIPHDEMNVFVETSQGVNLAFNHGHKVNGSDATAFEKWLGGQVRGDERAFRADIWVTAHRHNFQAWDLGSCSVFQCPSLDGGSKWFRDTTGKYSNSGILAFLAGDHTKTKWSDLAFL